VRDVELTRISARQFRHILHLPRKQTIYIQHKEVACSMNNAALGCRLKFQAAAIESFIAFFWPFQAAFTTGA
jgi:hypothetical protein